MLLTLVVVAGVITAIALTVQSIGKSKTGGAPGAPPMLDGMVVGTATSETTMRGPLSGRECVYWTLMVTKPTDLTFAFSASRASIVGLEAAAGERVRFSGDTTRYALSASESTIKTLPLRDLPVSVRELVHRDGEDDVVFEVVETTLAPSATVYVSGSKTADGSLRVDTIYDAPPRRPDVRPHPAR